jgi:hypothetical protein
MPGPWLHRRECAAAARNVSGAWAQAILGSVASMASRHSTPSSDCSWSVLKLVLDRLAVEPRLAGDGIPCAIGASSTAWSSVWRAARSSTSSGEIPRRAMQVWSTRQPNRKLPAVPARVARALSSIRGSQAYPLELRVEPTRRLRGEVLGRRQARHRCTGGPISGWSSSRSHVPSAWRRTTCARTPAPSRAIVEVRAMSPLTSVGSGSSGSKVGALARTCSHSARIASRPNGDVARRVAHHRVGLVQGCDAGGVPGVGAPRRTGGSGLRAFGPSW